MNRAIQPLTTNNQTPVPSPQTSAKNTVPKDHWLSQFYLRNFAITGYTKNQNAKIWITDLRKGTCSREKVREVAQEKHFYSFRGDNGNLSRRVDEKLTWLEDKASVAYVKLLEGKVAPGTWPSAKALLALFIATTFWRVPGQRRKTSETHQLLRDFFDKVPKTSSGRPLAGYVRLGTLFVPYDTSDYLAWNKSDENTLQQLFAEKIEALGRDTASRLFEKRWVIFQADRPVLFTGDAPLIKIDEKGNEAGIDTAELLFFPLSSSHVLHMVDRKEAEMDDYFPLHPDQAKEYNLVIRANSPAFLFSPRELSSAEIADPR